MAWHGNRHSGGVKGTRLLRAHCPQCGRNTAGGTWNRARLDIVLKPHKALIYEPARTKEGDLVEIARFDWCPGSRMIVHADRALSA